MTVPSELPKRNLEFSDFGAAPLCAAIGASTESSSRSIQLRNLPTQREGWISELSVPKPNSVPNRQRLALPDETIPLTAMRDLRCEPRNPPYRGARRLFEAVSLLPKHA